MLVKNCLQCNIEFLVPNHRPEAKFCSHACSSLAKVAKPNTVCTQCGAHFHIKPSQKVGKRSEGFFCCVTCFALHKRVSQIGSNNTNYKGRNVDQDGYRIYVPPASNLHFKGMKLHQAICCEILGIKKMPKGVHIHHRDCDILNNDPLNLVVFNVSDHKWLHKQFGIAALWAYFHGKVELAQLVSWSDDQERAARLLPLHVAQQVGSIPEIEASA